jgi:hypothetical protein
MAVFPDFLVIIVREQNVVAKRVSSAVLLAIPDPMEYHAR